MDPIADLLSRIRNSNTRLKDRVDVPFSKLKLEIVRILKDEGFIANYKSLYFNGGKHGTIRVFLKYGPHGEKVITGLERISRPGRRVYLGVQDVPTVLGGLGTSILTTSRGVMTGRAARKAGVGGEVLCNVW